MDEKAAKLKVMDDAAEEAKKELLENIEQWSAKDLIAWWARRYLTAGHKRLGRVLVAISKSL